MTIEEKKVDKEAESVWAKFAYTASDGKTYQVDYYNLDVIISVGYKGKVRTRYKIPYLGYICFTPISSPRLFRESSLDSLTGEYGQAYDPY